MKDLECSQICSRFVGRSNLGDLFRSSIVKVIVTKVILHFFPGFLAKMFTNSFLVLLKQRTFQRANNSFQFVRSHSSLAYLYGFTLTVVCFEQSIK